MSRGWGYDDESLEDFIEQLRHVAEMLTEDEPCKLDGRNCTGHPHYGGKL